MPTDDERREVARRLRKNVGKKMQLILNVAFSAFEFTGCSERTVNADEAALRLADLIDPDNIPDNAAVTGRNLSEPEAPTSSDAAPTCDRDALLALADDIDKQTDGSMFDAELDDGHYIARRIREAVGA